FGLAAIGISVPRKLARAAAAEQAELALKQKSVEDEDRNSIRASLETAQIELCLGKQLSSRLLASQLELAHRVSKMRKKFAVEYGFVVPEIKVTDDFLLPPKTYRIKIHGTVVASHEMRVGEILVIPGDRPPPHLPGEEVREPAFGMKAYSVPETFAAELKRDNYMTVDNLSVLLTHLSEIVRNNLAQLLSYKDMRALLDRLGPEYRKLLDDICPAHLSYSGLQAVLKLLLSERVSIRNLNLILEAIAEVAPHIRRSEMIAEHVRMRMAQQICGDLADNGSLCVLRLGNRWDLVFHQSLKRDAKGEITEFDIDPRLLEQFGTEATAAIRKHLDAGERFVLVASPEARPYIRMIIERLFATLSVLSHVEIARGVEVRSLGTIS
ncbi:MAG: FHIPEP family type III secretion protein, partial [Alphaproteobacteria bacterium]